MKTSTHPFPAANNPHAPFYNPVPAQPAPKDNYRILAYPSGDLLAVELEGGQVLMDLDQARELLAILTVAVPAMEKETP